MMLLCSYCGHVMLISCYTLRICGEMRSSRRIEVVGAEGKERNLPPGRTNFPAETYDILCNKARNQQHKICQNEIFSISPDARCTTFSRYFFKCDRSTPVSFPEIFYFSRVRSSFTYRKYYLLA